MRHNIPCTPQEILDWITNSPKSVAYDYIILGKSGPTGKTWLYDRLKERKYNVTELSEWITGLVNYPDDSNHIIINDVDMKMIIILNKPLERKRGMRANIGVIDEWC